MRLCSKGCCIFVIGDQWYALAAQSVCKKWNLLEAGLDTRPRWRCVMLLCSSVGLTLNDSCLACFLPVSSSGNFKMLCSGMTQIL